MPPVPTVEAGHREAGGLGGYVGAVRVTFPWATATPQWHGVRVAGCRELTLLTRVELFDGAAGEAAGRQAARDRALAAVSAVPCEPRLLLAEHARAHAAAFGDVALDLGASAAERRLPVGELLDRQAACPDAPLPALLEKLFDSGRYLLLSASGPLPPRLTGIWQGDWNPAWSGAITTDANLGLQLAGAVTTDVPAAVDAVANLIAASSTTGGSTRGGCSAPAGSSRRPTPTASAAAPRTSSRAGRCTPGRRQRTGCSSRSSTRPSPAAMPVMRPRTLRREALLELAAFYEDFLTRRDA